MPTTSYRNDFFDDLLPQGGEESKQTGKLTGDLKQKMGQFFGGGNDNDSFAPKARPYTTEARTEVNQEFSSQQTAPAIEEFAVSVSRRKGRTATLREREQGTRPQTTPADQSRNYNLDLQQNRDDESKTAHDNWSNFDAVSTNYGGAEPRADQKDEAEEDHQSEYVPSSMARTRERRSKGRAATTYDFDPTGILTSKETPRNRAGQKETLGGLKNYPEEGQSVKSHKAAIDINPIEKETSTANGSMHGLDQTRERNRPQSQIFSDNLPPRNTGKFDDKLNFVVSKASNLPQAHPKTEASVPAIEDFFPRQQVAQYEQHVIGDEITKKMLNDTNEYYKGMIEELKKHHKDERARMEEGHQRAIEILKKEKQLLLEQMELNLQREKDRLTEIHKQETESLERLHKYEIEQERRLAEENSENLKKQLEAQIRMNSLAEEFRTSSSKISTLFEKIGYDKASEDQGKKRELEARERALEEREMKIRNDIAILEKEKSRYDRLLADLESKESEILRRAEEEREVIRKEYLRLSELQDQLKEKEIEQKKEILQEKMALEQIKNKKERENLEIIEEYKRKYKELELRIQLFEKEKNEFTRMTEETEQDLRRRTKEADEVRQQLAIMEAECHKKLKANEMRELATVRGLDELKTKLDVFESERSAFEREKIKVHEIAKKAKEESEVINKFKREFDAEKDRLMRMKAELDAYSTSLQNEKLKLDREKIEVAQLKRLLEGMRYGYVKTFETDPGVLTPRRAKDLMFDKNTQETKKQKPHAATTQNFFIKDQLSPIQHANEYEPRIGLEPSFSVNDLREQINGNGARTERIKEKKRSSSRGNFDLKSYMNELKNLDKASAINGEYVVKEKESLIRNKVENETVVFKKALKSVKLEVETL